MKPQINVITLAVNNLQQSLEFYRDGLGFPTEGIIGTEFTGSESEPAGATVMFKLSETFIFSLYPRTELAKDAGIPVQNPSSTEFTLGYLAESKTQVDEILKRAVVAGAKQTEAAHERPWGPYSGFFTDLDGHLWEIVWNPALTT